MFWVLVSYESPAEHPTITEEERRYIEESIGESAQLMGATEVSLRPGSQCLPSLRETFPSERMFCSDSAEI